MYHPWRGVLTALQTLSLAVPRLRCPGGRRVCGGAAGCPGRVSPVDAWAKMFSFIRRNGEKRGKAVGYFCEKPLFNIRGIW